MARPRLQRVAAVPLRRLNLGEADRILVLYTRQQGKVRVIAKGVRRTTSHLGGHLDLLCAVDVLLAQGRDLDVVSQAQVTEPFQAIRADLERTAQAFVIAEMVDAGTPEGQAQPDLYNLLIDSLKSISTHPSPDLAGLSAQIHLLARLGFRPELGRCLACQRELQPVENFIKPAGGGVMCPDCGGGDHEAHRLAVDVLKLLRVLQRATVNDCPRISVPAPTVACASAEIRSLWERSLDRALRSPSFVSRVRETPVSPPVTGSDGSYNGACPIPPQA
jgi:DNA repair protein RecO (recombination protein O)